METVTARTGTDQARSPAGPNATYAICPVCPHHCRLAPGATGRCRARANVDGQVRCTNYGRATSLALDPVEKKPLARWRPGSRVLSVGSYGCNMACPWCQNHAIAAADASTVTWHDLAPDELVRKAVGLRERDARVTGIAFTYNEPLVGWEYVRDCATRAHERGLACVLVSNGMACAPVIDELAGLIDAANIDLKAADPDAYRAIGGDLATVRATIETLAADPACHLEVTTLMVPGVSDDAADIEGVAQWLASVDPAIVYHLTRYFPCHHAAKRPGAAPTPIADVQHATEVARRHLEWVYMGNC